MLRNKYKLKSSHPVIYDEKGTLCIGEIPGFARVVKNPPKWLHELLKLLDGSRTVDEIYALLLSQGYSIDKNIFLTAIKELKNASFLEDSQSISELLTETELQLYDRQMLYFSLVEKEGHPASYYQEKLKEQHALIFGAGGWGTWTALNLSLSGFGELTLVDGDVVELTNLNRQVLYNHQNIGMEKVRAAQYNLNKINPTTKINIINKFLKPNEIDLEELIPHNCTLIVLAWTNLAYFKENTIEESIHTLAHQLKIPLVEFGADPLSVSIGPLYVNDYKSPCFKCVKSYVKQAHSSSDILIKRLQDLRLKEGRSNLDKKLNSYQSAPSLSIMGGLAVDQLVKFVTSCEKPLIVGNKFHLSLQTYQIHSESFQCNTTCSQGAHL